MQSRTEVVQRLETFRDLCQPNLYDFYFAFWPHHLVSCCGWGPPVSGVATSSGASKGTSGPNTSQLGPLQGSTRQEIFFGTRADEHSVYNGNNNQKWLGG